MSWAQPFPRTWMLRPSAAIIGHGSSEGKAPSDDGHRSARLALPLALTDPKANQATRSGPARASTADAGLTGDPSSPARRASPQGSLARRCLLCRGWRVQEPHDMASMRHIVPRTGLSRLYRNESGLHQSSKHRRVHAHTPMRVAGIPSAGLRRSASNGRRNLRRRSPCLDGGFRRSLSADWGSQIGTAQSPKKRLRALATQTCRFSNRHFNSPRLIVSQSLSRRNLDCLDTNGQRGVTQ